MPVGDLAQLLDLDLEVVGAGPIRVPAGAALVDPGRQVAHLRDALGDLLAEQHPATESQLFSAEGELNRYVNVYVNDEDVRVLAGLDTAVGPSDTLVILPAMAGGAV